MSTTADLVLALKYELKAVEKKRAGYTLLSAMRSWEFEAFEDLRREKGMLAYRLL